ncbi:MAG: di-heme oxidoredictase family protein [Litorilituus sp.]|nr:di-heme oxidoredictase family protein [Litorilituus sp.]
MKNKSYFSNFSPFVISCVVSMVLTACGDSSTGESPVPVIPAPPAPIVDHSGLTPLDGDTLAPEEYLAGGDATIFVSNEDAFSTRPQMIADDFQSDGFFTSGDHLFRTPDKDIGPLLSTGSCQGCHVNDGRGNVPASSTAPMLSMLLKLGNDSGLPDPIYGDQLQPFAVQSFTTSDFNSGISKHDGSVNGTELYGEAFPFIEYETITGSYPDGTSYELRNPVYKVKNLSFGPFMDNIRFSARVAPQAFGVGLLEAIPTENIQALVDENDSDNDGISGRASMAIDVFSGETKLGRFAYKAQNTSVLQQVAGAYGGDIGISTSLFPSETCTVQQIACQMIASLESKVDSEHDFADKNLALVEFYNRTLGVPVRRGYDENTQTWDEDIIAGRKLFFDIQCVDCHTPRHITGEAAGSVLGGLTLTGLEGKAEPIAMLSEQTVFPYTDLLLHDMGGSCAVTRETTTGDSCSAGAECMYVQRCEGLADGLIQGNASGTEWKTPALWGIGLVQTVNAKASFLHDGRARTIEEAILWHNGEAASRKEAFMALSKAQRQQLINFVKSL